MNNNIVVHHSSESEEENDENQPTPKRRRGDYQEVASVSSGSQGVEHGTRISGLII